MHKFLTNVTDVTSFEWKNLQKPKLNSLTVLIKTNFKSLQTNIFAIMFKYNLKFLKIQVPHILNNKL